MAKKKEAEQSEEIIEDEEIVIEDEDAMKKNLIATLKKDLLSRGKEAGSLDQGEIMDIASKYDFSEDDVEELIDFFQGSGIKIISEDEDVSLEDADLNEIDIEKQNQEMEEDEDLNDSDEKEEVESIDDFSKLQSGEVKVNDSVKMYLKEIGKVNLLSAKEETELAKRIVAGEKAKEKIRIHYEKALKEGERKTYEEWYKAILVNSQPEEISKLKYNKYEEKEVNGETIVVGSTEDGEAAKSQLITANLRLVISIAKHYVGRGMHFLDLIQEGNMGLIKAVEKFDYTKGFKFSTYATWWIRQAITRAIADQARTIRIPVHMVETINKMTRFQRQLVQELGREPTPEEISREMQAKDPKGALSPERIREIQRIAMEPVSLETPIGEEDDSHLGDFIEDKETQSPSEYATKSCLRDELEEIMKDLGPRERAVLELRFGLNDGHPRTLEEVGKKFGVTRERIRQIESKALRRLRHPSRSKKLGDYRDNVSSSGPDFSRKNKK